MKIVSGNFCADQSWDRTDAHALVKHFTTVFLPAELKHDFKAVSVLAQDDIDFHRADYQKEIKIRSPYKNSAENPK